MKKINEQELSSLFRNYKSRPLDFEAGTLKEERRRVLIQRSLIGVSAVVLLLLFLSPALSIFKKDDAPFIANQNLAQQYAYLITKEGETGTPAEFWNESKAIKPKDNYQIYSSFYQYK